MMSSLGERDDSAIHGREVGLKLECTIQQDQLSSDCWAVLLLTLSRHYDPSIQSVDSGIVREWVKNQHLTQTFTEKMKKKVASKGGIPMEGLEGLGIVQRKVISGDDHGWEQMLECLSWDLPIFAEVKYNIKSPSTSDLESIMKKMSKAGIEKHVETASKELKGLENWTQKGHLVVIVRARIEAYSQSKQAVDGRWVLILDASNHQAIKSLYCEKSPAAIGPGAVWTRWTDLIKHGYLKGFIGSNTHNDQMKFEHKDAKVSAMAALRYSLTKAEHNAHLVAGSAMYQLKELRLADPHLKEVAKEIGQISLHKATSHI